MNTGEKAVFSGHRMLTTAAWKLNGKMTFALEGSAFIAGAVVQWLRDGLHFFQSAAEIEQLAAQAGTSDGVVLVPALSGLGAPHWNPDARGVIWGMTRGTTRGHIAYAALEGIALQNVDILTAMENDLQKPLTELKVDGGASANNLLMQMQSDFLNRRIVRPAMLDTTALGAALFAGLGAGIFTDLSDIQSTWQADATFTPSMDVKRREEHLRLWNEALKRV
jgi:glycerol kinase